MSSGMCDITKINGAYVQENGIIRLENGMYIGRLDGVEYDALKSQSSGGERATNSAIDAIRALMHDNPSDENGRGWNMAIVKVLWMLEQHQ